MITVMPGDPWPSPNFTYSWPQPIYTDPFVEFKTLYRRLIMDEALKDFRNELEANYDELLITRESFGRLVEIMEGIRWDIVNREPTP